MKILLVTPYFVPQTGGVVTFVDSLQRRLRRRGHRVKVLVPGSSNKIRPTTPNGPAYEFYMRLPWVKEAPVKGALAFFIYLIPTLWRLKRFLRANAIDVVSLEYPLPYMFYFRLLRAVGGATVVVGIHGSDILSLSTAFRYEQWLVKCLIRGADCVLAHSASLMERAEALIGRLPAERFCIPYGVDPDELRAAAANPNGCPSGPIRPYVLTAAKLHPRKGLDVLLHAVKKLGAKAENHRFVIAGDGPDEDHLRKLASELGVQGRVTFVGALQPAEIAKCYQDCAFFVLPSRSEPFGIALLEAMVFEKAIVATRVGGIPEFVFDGYNGLLVPAEDSNALAAQIARLLDDAELKARLGKNGKRTVEEKYSYELIIDKYEGLFERVAARDSQGA